MYLGRCRQRLQLANVAVISVRTTVPAQVGAGAFSGHGGAMPWRIESRRSRFGSHRRASPQFNASICLHAVKFGGEGDDRKQDLILGESVQGQVRQPSVRGWADTVFAARSTTNAAAPISAGSRARGR